MKWLVLFSLAAALIVTGCVASTNQIDTNGVRVNEFSADPPVAEFNDNVRFFLDVENVGGTTATCVQSELFGVDAWRDGLTGQPFDLPVVVAAPQKGIFFNIFFGDSDNWRANGCYYNPERGTQYCTSFGETQGDFSLSAFVNRAFGLFTTQFCDLNAEFSSRLPLHRFQSTLSPPLPVRNKQGQSWTAEWVLSPPVLPEGVRQSYDVTARTSYFYTSNAAVNIQAFNKNEFRRRQALNDPDIIGSTPAVNNVYAAPIQIQITRGQSPIIVNQDPLLGPYEYVSYTVEFQNVGEGYPLPITQVDLPSSYGPGGESGLVFATATINGPGAFFSQCLGQTGTEIFIPADTMKNLVKIRSDGRAPFGCQIGIERSRWAETPVGTITITFQVWYRYYVDEQVTVDVVGPERF